jgi:hypothetical protein
MKITDDMLKGWFPNHVKPTRIGLYETHRPFMTSQRRDFMVWTGFCWTYQDGSYTDFGKPYGSENKSKWRGLKEPMAEV